MPLKEKFIKKAKEEIHQKALGTTQQYLEILGIQYKEGLPEIARTNIGTKEAVIYFVIENQKFFFAVHLKEVKGRIETIHTWIECGNRVYFTAVSKNHNFQKLQSYLTLKPLKGWSKGDIVRKNYAATFSRISFEPNTNEAYKLEEALSNLLDELEKDSNGILKLTKNSKAHIAVCRHEYTSANAGISFSIKTIRRLEKLNLAIDIDTYIGGKPIK